jgi:branched-chain amino acid transport system permease protein
MYTEVFLQLLFNSISAASLILLVAYGFSMIFHTLKVFHIAHGAFTVFAPYVIIASSSWIPASGKLIMIVLAVILTASVAVVAEKSVYLPLFKKGSTDITSFIASLGLYLFLVNGIALVTDHRMKILSGDLRATYDIGPVLVNDIQILQILLAILIIGVIIIYLKLSGRNKILEAISDNPHIAKIIGLPVKSSRVVAIFIGTVLAAVAGILMAYDTGINPHSGMSITLTSIVVVLLAGRRDLSLLIIISLFMGLLQQGSSWYLSSAWADGLTFGLLLAVLFFRTEGVLTYQLRKDHAI